MDEKQHAARPGARNAALRKERPCQLQRKGAARAKRGVSSGAPPARIAVVPGRAPRYGCYRA